MKILRRGIVPVRLPPSVITLIESYLHLPNFHPVTSPSPSRSSAENVFSLSGSSNDVIGRSGRQQRVDRVTRPLTDPIPIDVPWYLRQHDNVHSQGRANLNIDVVEYSSARTAPAQNQHLSAAHAYLDSISIPSSSTSSIQRQITYSKFITTFLSYPSHSQLSAIPSLLSRSLSEGIPISSITLTQILKSTLSTPIEEDRREVISKVLKLLPDNLDLKLLDVLLRAVIRDFSLESHVVEGMIDDCLDIEQKQIQSQAVDIAQKGKVKGKGKENWPLDMWDILLYSHSQKGDFRAALHTLDEMRSVIEVQKENKPTKTGKDQDKAAIAGQKEAICKAYTTTLNLWHHQISKNTSRIPGGRFLSKIPCQLARDLIKLLEGLRPTIGFLNSWFRAERLAENWDVAQRVWDIISSPDSDSAVGAGVEGGDRTGPDSHSWTLYFGLYHIPHPKSDLQPLRESVSRLFTGYKSKSTALTTPLINSIISAIAAGATSTSRKNKVKDMELDLPLLLLLLRRAITVDDKTIDTVSSIIYRAARALPPSVRKELGLYIPTKGSISTRSPGSVRGSATRKWMRLGLDFKEWDVLSNAISEIKSKANSDLRKDDDKDKTDKGSRTQEVHLPLSAPIARLDRLEDENINVREGHHDSSSTITTSTVSDSNPNQVDDRNQRSTAQSLLPTMISLLEKTIIASASARVRNSSTSTRRETDEQVLSDVMRRVNVEVLPPCSSRREKRLARRASLSLQMERGLLAESE